MRKSRFQEKAKKTSIFETPFFPTLADFGCSEVVQNGGIMEPFSLLFRSWGLIFVLGGYFLVFLWICVFLELFFIPQTVLALEGFLLLF